MLILGLCVGVFIGFVLFNNERRGHFMRSLNMNWMRSKPPLDTRQEMHQTLRRLQELKGIQNANTTNESGRRDQS